VPQACAVLPAEVTSSEEGLLKVLSAFEAAEGTSIANSGAVRANNRWAELMQCMHLCHKA